MRLRETVGNIAEQHTYPIEFDHVSITVERERVGRESKVPKHPKRKSSWWKLADDGF